ncbi:pilin [Aeromonas salmonicida]|uniref:pilin n=1 Tax=Aeromonas salmonicida TaxID=645 RepID=UPI003D203ADB
MKKQSGFTLIELMIVVAIVAILAAIALPAYQNYTKKAKMTELVSAVSGQKLAIEVCVQTNGESVCLNDRYGIAAAAPSAGASAAADTVTVLKTAGVYEITATAKNLSPLVDNEKYVLTSSDTTDTSKSISWTGECLDSSGAAQTDYCP